jgi:hypothetical protein
MALVVLVSNRHHEGHAPVHFSVCYKHTLSRALASCYNRHRRRTFDVETIPSIDPRLSAMRRWTLLPVCVFLALTVSTARGNEAPPPKPESIKIGARDVKLVVMVDEKAKTARLIIPQGLLTDDKRRSDAGVPTILAGLALTLAFVSGGLWLARTRARKVAAAILVVALLAFGTAALYADLVVRPKPEPKAITLPAGITLSDKMTLEVAEKGDTVKLIVNSSMVVKAAK